MGDPTKAELRRELERLTAEFDGNITRRKRDIGIEVHCPA
jgi:hypothetical protein